ncbi:hypothetical protein [Mycobacterium avium]|uniref:hypothetical protein n=1 Tax=Mycobacterium avium TaxID=1764 RepID=UPI001E549F9E|nr:hypothetical protein [Mycobacterium avium]
MQITVTVAHVPLGHPPLEQGGLPKDEFLDIGTDFVIDLGGDGAPDERAHLVEILLPVRDHAGRAAVRLDVGTGFGPAVQLSQGATDPAGEPRVDIAARQLGRQHAVFGQPPHPHGRLARPGLAADPVVAVLLGDVDDAEVHLRAEPPVEPQFFVAVGAALLDAGEVEEAQVHRLLQLVGVGAGEYDPRAVRLVQAQVVGRRVVRVGSQKIRDDPRLSVGSGGVEGVRHGLAP